jgi:dTDP-4-amino-4,6-dideoxygalactose transaminase
LADNESLILPRVPDWADPVWHLFVIRHPRRDALQQHLTERGVASLIHYPIPPHRSGAYSGESGNHSWPDLPIAESLAEEILSLPIGPHLREEQLSVVCDAVREFVN